MWEFGVLLPNTPCKNSFPTKVISRYEFQFGMYGCVGAIDGQLMVAKCPPMKDSVNYPSSY